MRTPKTILTNIKSNRHEDDSERMDFLMKTIKTVHSSSLDPEKVSPEMLEKHRASADSFSRLVTPVVGVEVESFNVGNIKCEKVSPKFVHREDKIILYCHGGGYISGGLGYARILAAKLAMHTGLSTISFEYRLAPENKYPAQLEDAITIWDFIMKKGYGAKDVIVAGDSAGGNLSLELCFELRKEERILPKALILMSPWTDMRCTNASYKTYEEKDPLLTYEYIVMSRSAYAGAEADFENEKYSPLMGDFTNMPPTLIQVGSNEILRDDSEKLANKYDKYGAIAKLEVYQGAWHVFQQMPISKAGQAFSSISNFVKEVL